MADSARPLSLLVVDDEEALLWTISERLPRDRYLVSTASDGAAALDRLAATRVDVLVADIRMPRMNGLELVMNARRARPDLAVVVMTAYPTTDVLEEVAKDKGSIEYLEKPFEFSQLVKAIERARERNARGFVGAIAVQTLPDVVQLYALSNATGALEVSCDGEHGVIWFERGTIPHAAAASLVGESAFHRILSWTGGSFTMRVGEPPPARTIAIGWMELVLESCRLADERGAASARGFTHVPPPTSDPALAALSIPRSPIPVIEPPESTMSNYKDALAKLTSLEGFIGSCLCDSESGMILGTVGGSPSLNLEVAGAANSEVIRAKRKAAKALKLDDTIEDILITLGKQYHLMRPLKSRPAVFFYLALDRAHSNLAMARLALADVERDVTV